jgi:hypothetical protein
MKTIIFIFFILFSLYLPAQTDINIVDYLKQIENGEGDAVKELLPELKKNSPGAPSLLYLEGILTEDGDAAVKIYNQLADKHPRSSYSDAALFRLYSYYAALDNKTEADRYASRLRTDYISSPYTKMIPAVVHERTVEKEEIVYTIQAGAFTNFGNAENLKKKFQKEGYYTKVQDKMTGGTLFKIVYAGKFKTVKEAESFQLILNKKYGLKGIITRLPE